MLFIKYIREAYHREKKREILEGERDNAKEKTEVRERNPVSEIEEDLLNISNKESCKERENERAQVRRVSSLISGFELCIMSFSYRI